MRFMISWLAVFAACSVALQKNWLVNVFSSEQGAQEVLHETASAFSKLELFISTFPGATDLKDDEHINGFTELQETLIRSLQFFWPRENLKLTAVMDDTTYSNEQEKNNLVSKFRSLFADDITDKVSIAFNPRSNTTLYGSGWYMQQLIMLWADNFTESEYIGFIDDDTIISSVVHPGDLFDENDRPRVIAKPAQEGVKAWIEATEFAFKRKGTVYTMTYFPVIVKRKHFKEMREAIMKLHPEYSCFDEFFAALIHRSSNKSDLSSLSQFCLIMDYVFEVHRDEYSWHFETNRAIESLPKEMFQPLPRVAIHGTYLFMAVKALRRANTVAGRKLAVSEIMKEGYCFSLPSWNTTDLNARRCGKYHVDDNCYVRGQWRFEQYSSVWMQKNVTEACLAHAKRMEQNVERIWDDNELKRIFGS